MKKNFRKIISLLCTVALLASSLTVILSGGVQAVNVTTVPGIYETDAGVAVKLDENLNETSGDGENCLKFTVNNTRSYFSFANAEGNNYYNLQTNTTYYVSFQVLIKQCSSDTDTTIDFTPYISDGQSKYELAHTKVKYHETSTDPKKYCDYGDNVTVQNRVPKVTIHDKWQTVSYQFTTKSDTKPHFFGAVSTMESKGSCTVYVKGVHIGTAKITYYDNGKKFVDYAEIDDEITLREGTNSFVDAMGNISEEFMGWYTEPDFVSGTIFNEGKLDYTVTADNTTPILFARYPSTVIDFNLIRGKIVGGDCCCNDKTTYYINVTNDGIAQYRYHNENGGIMIPAYDYDGFDNSGKFYQFDVQNADKTYKITFFYKNAAGFVEAIPSTGYSTGWRIGSGVTEKAISGIVNNNDNINCFTADIAAIYKNKVKTSTASDKTVHKDAIKTGLAVRGGNIDYDKIVITEISPETEDYRLKKNIISLDDKYNGTSGIIMMDKGDKVKLPQLENTADRIFGGWVKGYEYGVEVFGPEAGQVSLKKDYTPKTVFECDGNDATLTAKWIDREKTINFTSDKYESENFQQDHSNNSIASSGIYYDKDNQGIVFTEGTVNGSYFLLYDDEGNYVDAAEGTEYDITIEYSEAVSGESVSIGVVRNGTSNVKCVDVEGGTTATCNNADKFTSQDDINEHKVIKGHITVKNTYDLNLNGIKDGGDRQRLRNVLAISPISGAGTIYSVTVEATACHPYAYIENADINISDAGMLTVDTYEGYELKYGTLKAYKLINRYRDPKTIKVIKEVYGEKGVYDLKNGGIDNPEDWVFTAETVSSNGASDNAAPAGRGVRLKAPGVTAGIRFKARLSNATIKRYEDLYFAIAPVKVLDYAEAKTMEEMLKGSWANLAVKGYAKQGGGDTLIYDIMADENGCDILCMLTGIDDFVNEQMYFALIGKEENGDITELTHDVFSYRNYRS